ncbi:MAG TPA: aminotransferase class V-fold PLP-dependent enzyme [Baekduia sp.]|uniref:aminotransferase class V-fold PLP-dependent enzyme n=1 Tax=Baekduia sp. TaxID=2600305 RepID=UPI002D79A7FC|nr:aminotransferase class V-fold PLP-dependent enzyme [Baekduia sp.]HET6505319.1 aminotransferase class V-fold PLP-dependent enzyme [Baekduia sp.]
MTIETSTTQRSDALVPREHFPVLEDVTYLNTASIGLVARPVQESASAFDREIASRGTTWFDEEQETGVLERARGAAARLLNVDPELIAIPSSATEALCQLAWHLRPAAGANVVSIDLEFPSVVYPWMRVAEETGAEVRLVDVRSDPGRLSLEAVAERVDAHTSVICVSHAQFATGCVLDLAGLSALARAHDARLVIDATQSAGMVPIDLAGVHVDALVAGGYKWLGGPFGAALLYVHPELLDGFRPSLVGWRSTPDPYNLDPRTMPLADGARRVEFSTMSYTAGQALGGAIEYLLDVGIERVAAHAAALADRLVAGLDALGAELLTPRERASRGGTVAARFPGRDGEGVAMALNRAGVIVSPRFGATRFATHLFNTPADVDRALEQLDAVLGRPAGDLR